MKTYRQQFEDFIDEYQDMAADAIPVDELTDLTRKVVDGFINVLSAATIVRNNQKAFFKARKAGLATHELLQTSKDAEKVFDDLIKFWTAEMSKPPSTQTKLFE